MNWTDRRRRVRTILKGDRCYHPASVFDPLSARIAQDLGFEVGMFAGSTASLTVLGAPDLILITLSEFAGQAYRINRAFDLPLLVDADHGYGNALNVMRTVQELETAGVSALTIEDTVLPRPYGPAGRGLTSIEEGVGRMRAALAARQDPDLVIVGRTVAMGSTSTEDALARAKAYAAAGVDAFSLSASRTARSSTRRPRRSTSRSSSAVARRSCPISITWPAGGCASHCRAINRSWQLPRQSTIP
jgi:carboxyvinyl-carboxyphosphonate phosphorylmutase